MALPIYPPSARQPPAAPQLRVGNEHSKGTLEPVLWQGVVALNDQRKVHVLAQPLAQSRVLGLPLRGKIHSDAPDFQSGEGPTCLTFDSIKCAFIASTGKLQATIGLQSIGRDSEILQSRLHRTTGCVLDLSASVQCFGQ
jgi:hypothetical protein